MQLSDFNPTKADVLALVEKSKGLRINGVNDKTGYEQVHAARMNLKNKRIEIEKKSKDLRADAQKFNKDVLALEHDLTDLIDPAEKELKEMEDEIELLKEMEKRRALLPERKEKLKALDAEVPDEEILAMDATAFQNCLNTKHHEYLAAKEKKIKEESDRVEAEKKKMEDARIARELVEKQEAERKAARDQLSEAEDFHFVMPTVEELEKQPPAEVKSADSQRVLFHKESVQGIVPIPPPFEGKDLVDGRLEKIMLELENYYIESHNHPEAWHCCLDKVWILEFIKKHLDV